MSGGPTPGGRRIDLSADLAEVEDPELLGGEAEILRSVTTAHLACGFHASNPSVMRRGVEMVADAGVVLGAHPSYRDPEGFGRRPVAAPVEAVVADVAYQVGALDALAALAGVEVASVKPHGALYHAVAADQALAEALGAALGAYGRDLVLVARAGSTTFSGSPALEVVAEGFCDRRYLPDASLVARGHPDALLTDRGEVVEQALGLALEGRVTAADGTTLELAVDTLCVHADTPGAPGLAAAVRRALEEAGVTVAPASRR